MTDYIRDIESREINYRAIEYIENTIISVLKDFFQTYPGCIAFSPEVCRGPRSHDRFRPWTSTAATSAQSCQMGIPPWGASYRLWFLKSMK